MGEILTALLVVITAFYAYVTHRILKANQAAVGAMREQSEALTRPYVVVSPYLPPKGWIFYLRIRNAGKTAATDLRLTLDRDFFRFGEVGKSGSNLAEYNAFNHPITTFPPGADLLFYLAQSHVIFGEETDEGVTPKLFTVMATYSYAGRTVREETQVDLRPFLESASQPDPLVEELEDFKKELMKWLKKST